MTVIAHPPEFTAHSRKLTASLLFAGILSALLPMKTANALDAVPSYDVIEIGPALRNLVPSLTFSSTLDVNSEGDAVGRSVILGELKPWLRASGQVQLLPVPPERPAGDAVAISDRLPDGDVLVVGNLQTDILDEPGQAWLWRVDTTTLEVLESFALPTLDGSTRTVARAINVAGVVVGSAHRPLPFPDLPVSFDYSTGTLEEIAFPAIPADITNAGAIAGGRYIGDLSGNATDVGVPDGSTAATITALNDTGAAAGVLGAPYTDGAGRFVNRLARWTGTWDLAIDAGAFGGAVDITNDGDVLGSVAAGASFQPALYVEAVGELHLVTSLLAPAAAALSVFEAAAINETGVIAASVDSGAALLVPASGNAGGPEVEIRNPGDGLHVYDRRPVTVEAVASDVDGVASIDVTWAGDAASGDVCDRRKRESVRCRWATRNLPTGTYTLEVRATDGAGNVSTTAVTATLLTPDPTVVYVGKLRLAARRGGAKARAFFFDGTGRRLRMHGEVTYEWTLPGGGTVVGSTATSAPGRADFQVSGSGDGEFALRITGVVIDGMTFDPAAGVPAASDR